MAKVVFAWKRSWFWALVAENSKELRDASKDKQEAIQDGKNIKIERVIPGKASHKDWSERIWANCGIW